MSKRKTVLKFSIASLLVVGSSTLAVLYFPYVALAIKFGIVVSTAPLAIFAISAVAALASVITLAAFTISAIRSKGKSNKVSSEPRSKNEEKGQSLAQEKDAPTPTPPLLSQEPEKFVIPVPQQQPVDDSVEGTETPQPENVMVNGADQQANQTEESLPPYPEPTSPLNSINQDQSFPSLPSIVMDGHNSSEGSGNYVQNLDDNSSRPNTVHDIFEYKKWAPFMYNCSSSYHTSMSSSMQEPDRPQASLGSYNPQFFHPEKKPLYDVNKKIFDSVDYQVNYTRPSEHAGKASNYGRVYLHLLKQMLTAVLKQCPMM